MGTSCIHGCLGFSWELPSDKTVCLYGCGHSWIQLFCLCFLSLVPHFDSGLAIGCIWCFVWQIQIHTHMILLLIFLYLNNCYHSLVVKYKMIFAAAPTTVVTVWPELEYSFTSLLIIIHNIILSKGNSKPKIYCLRYKPSIFYSPEVMIVDRGMCAIFLSLFYTS